MDLQTLSNGESFFSIRTKLNTLLQAIITGDEGANAIWAKIRTLVASDTTLQGNIDTLADDLSKQLLDANDYTDARVTAVKAIITSIDGNFYGFYANSNSLPTGSVAGYAYVATENANEYTIWNYIGTTLQWVNSGMTKITSDSTTPLIVNLTNTSGTYTADKTSAEVATAFGSKAVIVFKYNNGSGLVNEWNVNYADSTNSVVVAYGGKSGNSKLTYTASNIVISEFDLNKENSSIGIYTNDILTETFACSILNAVLYIPIELTKYYNIKIGMFGYSSENNRLYIGFYDSLFPQDSGRLTYFYKDYISKPTNGIEKIYIQNSQGIYQDCSLSITIDWSKMVDLINNGLNTLPNIYITTKEINKNEKLIDSTYDNVLKVTGEAQPTNFANCVRNGGYIIKGNLYLAEEITLPSGCHLFGNKCTIYVSNSNAKIIMSDNTSLNNINFKGDWVKSRTLNTNSGYYTYIPMIEQSAIDSYATYCLRRTLVELKGKNSTVNNCIFDYLTGTAIHVNNSSDRLLSDNISIINCYFNYCECGIYNSGEFNRFTTNIFHGCIYGYISVGGNYSFSGGIFKMCDVGILSDDNGNGGHSEISTSELGHSGIAGLYIMALPRELGLVLTCCHIADSPIIGISCNSLLITGSRLDTWVEINSGISNAFVANIIRNAYAIRDNKNLFTIPNNNYLKNNIAMVDGIDTIINN